MHVASTTERGEVELSRTSLPFALKMPIRRGEDKPETEWLWNVCAERSTNRVSGMYVHCG